MADFLLFRWKNQLRTSSNRKRNYGRLAVSRTCSKICNITLIIGTIWSFLVQWKINWNQQKAPSNRRNFAIYKVIKVKESNTDVKMFYRNRLNRRLCSCAVKTVLGVATNAAKSPKYQSLHAKFRTLLMTIMVVDFGTYSHTSYFIFNESYKLTIIYCTVTTTWVQLQQSESLSPRVQNIKWRVMTSQFLTFYGSPPVA